MAHAEGWIAAYDLLEQGKELPAALRQLVLSNRNGTDETMLHWYAIEGEARVLEKIVALGFEVDTVNRFGRTPLFECVTIGRWEIVELLLAHGARTDVKDQNGEDVFDYLEDMGRSRCLRKLRDLVARVGGK
jgi:ankyrin repeat protein